MFAFERLSVWQKAIDFADDIYTSTKPFPVEERFGLTNQLRRSAVSISSNIAEGSSRKRRDFARFVEIAHGSLQENVSQLFIARRQAYLAESSFDGHYIQADELARMLSGLRGSLLSNGDDRE